MREPDWYGTEDPHDCQADLRCSCGEAYPHGAHDWLGEDEHALDVFHCPGMVGADSGTN